MEWNFVSLCSVRHRSSRRAETSFFKLSSFFQISVVDRKDIGKMMEPQPRKMVVSSRMVSRGDGVV